ncbi:MAG: DUF4351 domain-containing protein [Candidatus Viridilinea halotolerans]|uniref:DUF4351 domain-containing protein n=1 Tax=Candidatus Viridilinea halotolerans TaxID=2491704 RepID=A0A426TTW9_9CHLR|nr:MAG: DUF4351 domain-containing protein [Candidatus Viridilinea halotolerans]
MSMPPVDFDGAWKYALEHCFQPFVAFFFPKTAALIDWQEPFTFCDKELEQLDPDLTTGKQRVDKLVRVRLANGQTSYIFVHIEIQAQTDEHFAERMYCYHARIFDRERLPVASLSVLGDESPSWRPDHFGYQLGETNLRLSFGAVKLLDLDLALLEASSNLIAILTLLHRDAQATRGQPEERMRRKLARFRSFLRKGHKASDLRLLYRFLDQLLRLNREMNEQVRATMRQIEQEEVGMDTFVTSIEELAAEEGEARGLAKGEALGLVKGEARGEARGIVKGQCLLALRQITRRFGPPPTEVQQRVETLSSDELLALGEALFEVASMEELVAWLKRRD